MPLVNRHTRWNISIVDITVIIGSLALFIRDISWLDLTSFDSLLCEHDWEEVAYYGMQCKVYATIALVHMHKLTDLIVLHEIFTFSSFEILLIIDQ